MRFNQEKKSNNVESCKEAKIKEKNMYIKEDGNRKNHKGQGKSDEENWKIRSPEEVLGDDELVKGISLKDIPDGKRVELQLSRRGVKKLYDEGVRVAKHDGFSDVGADAFARQLIEITLQSYVKGYVKSKFGIKTEDFDLIHSQNTTAAVIDEMIKHNTEE
jgi:hypothetical protein